MLRRFGIAVAGGFLGLAINTQVPVLVQPLMLGRAVTLAVAMLMGPAFGVVAAGIGAASQFGALGWALLPIEGLIAGLFARVGRSPLLGLLLLWLVVAGSIVAAPEFYGIDYMRQAVWPVALQLAITRLVAVVIADLIAATGVLR